MSEYNLFVDILNEVKKENEETNEEETIKNIEESKDNTKSNEDETNDVINDDLEKILDNSTDNIFKNGIEHVNIFDKKIKYNKSVEEKIKDNDFLEKLDKYNFIINDIKYIKIELINNGNEDELKISLKSLIKTIHDDIPEINLKETFEEIKDKNLNRKEILDLIESKINNDFISKNEVIQNIKKYIDSIDIILYILKKFIYNNNDFTKIILEILEKNNLLESLVKEMKYKTFNDSFEHEENIIKIIELSNYNLLKLYLVGYNDYTNTIFLKHAKQNVINNKSKESIKIYRFLKDKYNKVIKYKNKEHKKFCQNIDIYNIPNILIETKTIYNLYTVYMLPRDINFVKDISKIKENNYIEPQFVNIGIKNEDNFNFNNFYKKINYNINIDIKWYKKTLKYLRKLTLEDKLTVYEYTINSNFVNKYLLNELTHNDIEHIVYNIENNVKKITLGEKLFIPFYYQIMKVLNIYNFDKLVEHLKSYNKKYLYRLVVKIIPLVIKDLQRIIENSPPLERSFILYRGVKNVYYPLNKEYTTNSFTSTTLNLHIANSFGYIPENRNNINLIEFKLKKGDKCLFIEPLTHIRNECEFLINVGEKFNIDKKILKINYKNRIEEDTICDFEYKTLNVTTFYS